MKINNKEYVLERNFKEGFIESEVTNILTDYFYNFDYIVGDWAYGKLRLKGFYGKNSNLKKKINDIEYVDKYIKENCAYGCKYFILKKID